MVTQNRPYDDRKLLVALAEQGITFDTFDDVSIEIVYDDGQGDRAGATIRALMVWTVAAKDASAALDASESVSDDEVGHPRMDSSAIVPLPEHE